jgi:hypothetical protein
MLERVGNRAIRADVAECRLYWQIIHELILKKNYHSRIRKSASCFLEECFTQTYIFAIAFHPYPVKGTVAPDYIGLKAVKLNRPGLGENM